MQRFYLSQVVSHDAQTSHQLHTSFSPSQQLTHHSLAMIALPLTSPTLLSGFLRSSMGSGIFPLRLSLSYSSIQWLPFSQRTINKPFQDFSSILDDPWSILPLLVNVSTPYEAQPYKRNLHLIFSIVSIAAQQGHNVDVPQLRHKTFLVYFATFGRLGCLPVVDSLKLVLQSCRKVNQ